MPAERALTAASRRRPPAGGDAPWRNAVRLIAAATVLRILVAAALPLVPDESYYWLWSRHLAAGYFDHPPGIALAIHLGTLLMGPSRLGVRLGPILAGTLAALAVAATARRLAGDRAALRAAVVMTVLPLAAAGLVLATPDAPLLAWYACALYAVVRALQAPPSSRDSLLWWAGAGIALGLAFGSKYTSILLPVGVLVALATNRELRPRLREPGPYLAALLATLVFSPVLLWNSRHEWISFTFQLRHGLSPAKGSLLHTALKFEGELFGGQLGLASPILFVMMTIAVVCALRRRSPLEWLLAVVSVVVFAVFVYSALHKRVEANWPAPAYVSAIVLLCVHDWGVKGRRWLTGGVVLAGLISLVIYADSVAPILPVRAGRDPVARAFGWDAMTDAAVRAARESHAPTVRSWLGAERYQNASELAFHADDPDVFSLNLTGRANQYDLWPGFPERASVGDRLVLALNEEEGTPEVVKLLAPYFRDVRRGALVIRRRGGGEIGRVRIYSLDGWRGGWPARQEEP